MKKIVLLAAALGLAGSILAFDLGNAVGNIANDQAGAALTKKLKQVQNEKGPIVFKTGTANLDAKKCERTLKTIDGLIKNAPGFVVQIEGHTDNKGVAAKNMELSQKRAEAVRQWLIDHLQTPADRMTAKGFGDSVPLADNKTEKGRAKNRRVDFSVTKQ